MIEAGAGDLSVRFIWQKSEFGTDVAHTDCMTEQPVAGLPGVPRVSFEYDFMGGVVGDRRLLDSASHLDYEAPVKGHRSWRQRAVTIVGGGETLCAVSFAPRSAKKEARRLLDAILADLYGPQTLLTSGALPASLVYGNPHFLRPCHGIKPRDGTFLHTYAADLGRDADGRLRPWPGG